MFGIGIKSSDFNWFYAHLPYIGLVEPAIKIPYLTGVIRSLTYSEWESLDNEAAHNVRYAFERTAPVFFVWENLPSRDSGEDARRDMQDLYLAMVLSTGANIPAPSKSISYTKSGKSISRCIGIFDRAAVVHGPKRLLVDSSLIQEAATLVPLVKDSRGLLEFPGFKQVVRTLTSTATDDFHAIDGIVSCVIALEGLLLKNVLSGITATFTNRICKLLSASESNSAHLKSNIEQLYSLRSDALHGRNWKVSLSQTSLTDAQWYDYARQILCKSALAALSSLRLRQDFEIALDELRASLD
ncbi:hypothetical protein C7534_101552 [Pseudomonas sp. OV226]|nr:hypothetical protein C7534_101552 [Pseudomonas sp. OV226]